MHNLSDGAFDFEFSLFDRLLSGRHLMRLENEFIGGMLRVGSSLIASLAHSWNWHWSRGSDKFNTCKFAAKRQTFNKNHQLSIQITKMK